MVHDLKMAIKYLNRLIYKLNDGTNYTPGIYKMNALLRYAVK